MVGVGRFLFYLVIELKVRFELEYIGDSKRERLFLFRGSLLLGRGR